MRSSEVSPENIDRVLSSREMNENENDGGPKYEESSIGDSEPDEPRMNLESTPSP